MGGISANTINGLAQQQLAHAASFQSYANFLSDTHGTRSTPVSQAAVSGGSSGYDPRDQPYLPQLQPFSAQTGFATNMMGRLPGAVDAAATAGALGGAFGLLPRVFDPFTQTLGMAKAGWGAGGVGGALGYGLASTGAYMGAGMAANATIGQVMGGGQEQAQLSGMLSSHWNRSTMPFQQGMPTFGQQVGLGNMMAGMAGQDTMLSMGSLQGVMAQGLSGGSFSGSRNFGQFAQQFKELVSEVRQVAETFQSSLTEAYGISQRIKSLGFYGRGEAGQAAVALRSLGTAAGMQVGEAMGAMQGGADMWTQLGGSRQMGAATGLGVTAQIMSLAQAGIIDPNRLRDMMGGVPLGQAALGMGQRMLGYGARFAGTRQGRTVIGAMMDPETGQLDPSQLSAFPSMSWGEIQSAYSERTGGERGGNLFRSRFGDLSRQMTEQMGPSWWSTAIRRMSMQQGGSASGEELMTSTFGQMPQGEMQLMGRLGTFGGAAQSYLQNRTELALRHSLDEAQSARNMSWAGITGRLHQRFVQPLTQPLRRMGREALGSMQEWSGDVIDDFLGIEPQAQMTSTGAHVLGNLRSGIGRGFPSYAMGSGGGGYQPGPQGGFENTINQFMPAGAWTAYRGGEMGTGGLGSSQWNPYATGLLAASLPVFGGTSAIGGIGSAMASAGGALWGAGGMAGRSAGGLLGLAGRGIAGGAGIVGGVAGPLFAMDMAFNFAPHVLRNLDTPRAAIMEGGLTGDLANSLYGFARGGTGSLMGSDLGSQYGSTLHADGVPILHDPSRVPRGGFQGAMEDWMQPGARLMGAWAGEGRGALQMGFGSQASSEAFLGTLRGIRTGSAGMLGLSSSEQSYLSGVVGGLPGSERIPGVYERKRSDALVEYLKSARNDMARGLLAKGEGIDQGLGGLALYAAGGGDATSVFGRGMDDIKTKTTSNTELWRQGLGGLMGGASLSDDAIGELGGGAAAFVKRGTSFGLMDDLMLWEQSTSVDRDAKFNNMIDSILSGGPRGEYAPPGVLASLRGLAEKYRSGSASARKEAKNILIKRFRDGAVGNQPQYRGEYEEATQRLNVARSWGTRVGLRNMLGAVGAEDADKLYQIYTERAGPLAAEGGPGVRTLEEHTKDRNAAFWGMGMDELRGVVSLGRSAPAGAQGFFADADAHARVRSHLAEATGMGRDSYDELQGKGDDATVLGRRSLPKLFGALFADADRETYARFEKHIPSFTSGGGSRYGIELMKVMASQMGLGNDTGFVRAVSAAVATGGPGGGTADITKKEYQTIVDALAAAIKTIQPGGTGTGSPSDSSVKSVEKLAKAAEEAATWLHEMQNQ